MSCVSGRTQDASRSTDAAHVDAMTVRNKQYQMLHGKYQKLMAEKAAKSQLASRCQATELHQLRVCILPIQEYKTAYQVQLILMMLTQPHE
jgi:hypothetical protein